MSAEPLSAQDAAGYALWYARYSLDRVRDDSKRRFHPGVTSHLTAMVAQGVAVESLIDPANDQRVAEGTG